MRTEKKHNQKWVVLIIATLILLSASCTTTQKNEIYVPDIIFPEFPSLDGAYSIGATETVVPNAWLFKMAEYKILIDETQKNYEFVNFIQKKRRTE